MMSVIRSLRREILLYFRKQAEKEALEGKGVTVLLNRYAESVLGWKKKMEFKTVVLPQNIFLSRSMKPTKRYCS